MDLKYRDEGKKESGIIPFLVCLFVLNTEHTVTSGEGGENQVSSFNNVSLRCVED